MAKNTDKLFSIIGELNIASKFTDEQQSTLIERVFNGYETDNSSRKSWVDAAEEGFKLVDQILEEKNYPWEGAANVKYPLITVAAMQFAARAYPNIINGSQIVKSKTNGDPNDEVMAGHATAVQKHMNWQLTEEIENWDAETDAMLHALPVVGTYFRKTFYDEAGEAVDSIIVNPLNVIINNKSKSLERTRRITHEIELSKNDVIERERSGEFETISDKMESTNDQDTEEFLEQHCWFDWDDDGYEEPYIVTVHSNSRSLCRVVSCAKDILLNDKGEVKKIVPYSYWTKYSFIPNPKGEMYDLGFAHLLGPLNHSVNTVFNQLLDAGALSNLQAGFIAKQARGISGQMKLKPGEWIPIDTLGQNLKDSIFPLPVRDPSNVLFQLLGMMNEMAMKISSVTDVMTGDSPGQNVPATTSLAMIEQGLKVFTAIYKRIHRALKSELGKIYVLNSIFVDQKTFTLDGAVENVSKSNYTQGNMTIVPVTDPTQASQTQQLAKAQALLQVLPINPTKSGKIFTLTKYYEAVGMQPDEIALLLDKKELEAPQPTPPEVIKLQLDAQTAKDTNEIKRMELEQSLYKLNAEIEVLRTQALKNIADAEAKEAGQQLDQYSLQLQALDAKHGAQSDITRQHLEMLNNAQSTAAAPQQGQSPPMGGPAGNQGVPEMGGPAPQGQVGAAPVGNPDQPPVDGGNLSEAGPNAGPALRAEFNANPQGAPQ